MTDEQEKWGIGAAIIGFIAWLAKLVIGGEKRKIATETDKTRVETDNTSLDVRIKAEEYFEKKYTAALLLVEELRKTVEMLRKDLEQARKEAEDNKIALTLEKIKANKR